MKKIIAGILRRGFTTSKQATLANCIAFLYPLQYILKEGLPHSGQTVMLNDNAFWKQENKQNQIELMHDILSIHRRNIMDAGYFHILNRFENGDRYGIVLPTVNNVPVVKAYKRMFRALYEDQLVAAEEDYVEFLEREFGTKLEDNNWDNKEWAVATLTSLLSELQEDRSDFHELCAQCGLDQTTLTELGF